MDDCLFAAGKRLHGPADDWLSCRCVRTSTITCGGIHRSCLDQVRTNGIRCHWRWKAADLDFLKSIRQKIKERFFLFQPSGTTSDWSASANPPAPARSGIHILPMHPLILCLLRCKIISAILVYIFHGDRSFLSPAGTTALPVVIFSAWSCRWC